MECTDENIISLIQQLDRRSEYQGIGCLKKCEHKTYGVLLKMSLQDVDERKSIFYHSMAEFIIQVRRKKFVLTGEAKICTYLTEIARRKWLNNSKKNNKLDSLPENLKETITTTEGENNSGEQIKKALQQLDEKDRDILVMFYFYDMDLEEYSKQIGISYDATKKRISRARTRLKNILKPIQH